MAMEYIKTKLDWIIFCQCKNKCSYDIKVLEGVKKN